MNRNDNQRPEWETLIRFRFGEDAASIYTTDPGNIILFDELSELFPEDFGKIGPPDNGPGPWLFFAPVSALVTLEALRGRVKSRRRERERFEKREPAAGGG